MTKYVLSFTPTLDDKKEYVVAFTQHTNVYNDNHYIVAFSPWSIYSADIIDDMVRARKMRVKASRVFLKEATPILNMDGKIDNGLVNSKIATNSKNSVGGVTKGKLVMRGKVLPMQIEEGITSLKAKLDDKVSNFISTSSDGNIVNLLDDAFLILTKDATTIGIEWSEIINSGSVEGTDLGVHVKEIHNALKDEMESKQLAPLRFINTEHSVGTLLHEVGYRSDKLTERLDLNSILIGDQIGKQLNAILLQNIFKATDIALNMSKLKLKSMFIMGAESSLKFVSTFLADKMDGNLSNVSHFTESIKDNGIEESRAVNTTDSKVQSDIEHSRVVSSKHASNFERTDKAEVVTGSETSVFGDVEKAVNSTKMYGGSKSSIEDGKIISPVNAKVNDTMDWATVVSGAESKVFNLYGAKVVSGKKVSNLFKLEEADMVLSSTSDNGNTLNKAKVSKESFVRNLMVNERATIKISVSGRNVRELINSIFTKESYNTGSMKLEDAILSRDKYDSVVNSLDDMTFNIKLDSSLHGSDKAIVNNLMQSIIMSETEHGSVEESVIDTILEFLVEGSDNKVEVDVDFSNLVKSDASVGVKDVELSSYNDMEGNRGIKDVSLEILDYSDHGLGTRDTFLTVIGTSEASSKTETRLGTIEFASQGDADIDTVLNFIDKANHDVGRQVFYEKIESFDNLSDPRDVRMSTFDSSEFFSGNRDVALSTFDSSEQGSGDKLAEVVGYDIADAFQGTIDTVLNYLDDSIIDDMVSDVEMMSLDTSIVKDNPMDVGLDRLASSETTYVSSLDVELNRLDSSELFSDVVDVGIEKLSNMAIDISVKDTDINEVSNVRIDLGIKDTDINEMSDVRIDLGTKEVDYSSLDKVEMYKATVDTDLNKFDKVVVDSGVKDTSLERMIKVDPNTGIDDVSMDRMLKIDPSTMVRDTDLHETELSEKYNEYEGQMNDNNTLADNDKGFTADYIHEIDDALVSNEFEVANPSEHDQALKSITRELTIMGGDSGRVEMNVTSDGIAETEEADRYNSYDAQEPPSIEDGIKSITHGLTIGDSDYGITERGVNVDIADSEMGSTNSEREMQLTDIESFTKEITHSLEINGVSSGNIDRELKASESHIEDYVKEKMKVDLVIGGREEGLNDREYKTDVSDKDLGRKETEIDMGNIPDGEGGEVVPKDPTPVTPKDPKQKIWSIMGKNYPSWQNWNPKKTR